MPLNSTTISAGSTHHAKNTAHTPETATQLVVPRSDPSPPDSSNVGGLPPTSCDTCTHSLQRTHSLLCAVLRTNRVQCGPLLAASVTPTSCTQPVPVPVPVQQSSCASWQCGALHSQFFPAALYAAAPHPWRGHLAEHAAALLLPSVQNNKFKSAPLAAPLLLQPERARAAVRKAAQPEHLPTLTRPHPCQGRSFLRAYCCCRSWASVMTGLANKQGSSA